MRQRDVNAVDSDMKVLSINVIDIENCSGRTECPWSSNEVVTKKNNKKRGGVSR